MGGDDRRGRLRRACGRGRGCCDWCGRCCSRGCHRGLDCLHRRSRFDPLHTGNDDDANPPAPDYANRGQNFPTPTGAIGGHFRGIATGTLTTAPGDYTIEVFGTFTCDSSGHGEGAPFLASRRVNVPLPSTGDQNTKNWSIPIESPGAPLLRMPPLITATATDAAGNTSEFSTCEPYIDDTIFADGFDPVILF